MKQKLITSVLQLLLGFILFTGYSQTNNPKPVKVFPHPDRIRYDGHCMTIDGKDLFVKSAAFQYFRCPKKLWRDRFQKIKDAGFNTVETYIPWNLSELNMPKDVNDTSKFDFSDAKEWMKMAHEEFGFYTIIRPGPYICAEFSGGGFPSWLSTLRPDTDQFWIRVGQPDYLKWSRHWFDQVSKVLVDEQITRKPKGSKGMILIQIENEYDNNPWKNKKDVLYNLYDAVKAANIDVPIFSCLTKECRGSNDPKLSQVFDSDNYYVGLKDAPSCAKRMVSLRQSQPDAPGFVTELQGGWFSLVNGKLSEDNYSDVRHFNALALMSLLGGGTGINYYMFYGGTNFAGWGARGMTTSYDYNAPIRENGSLGPKYYVSKAINEFIQKYEPQLLRSEGGPCELKNAPANLFGGVRIAADGTKFVFLHNTDPKAPLSGTVTLIPGKTAKSTEPMYNINQFGEKVLIKAQNQDIVTSNDIPPFEVKYDLADLGAKILVIPPGANPDKGEWWPKQIASEVIKKDLPPAIRITKVLKANDPVDEAKWAALPEGTSLPEIDVNDFRYTLYRATVKLNEQQIAKETKLLFNTYSRDILTVRVNGKMAKRTFPANPDVQSWPSRDRDLRISPQDFDNKFNVEGLLKKGENEIIVVYENIGHGHGQVPMEESTGINAAGLSDTDLSLTHPLKWFVATDLAGITKGWNMPTAKTKKWKSFKLDTACEIPRKGNKLQPKDAQTDLVTWYRVEFELPDADPKVWYPWAAHILSSGNGYLWLNGNNIGRHWEAGPQREFYLPECWLNFGKGKSNVLIMALRQTENGALLKALEILPYPDSVMDRKD